MSAAERPAAASATAAAAAAAAAAISPSRVRNLRILLIAAVLIGWEALSMSGLLVREVVPSLQAIGKALWLLVGSGEFWSHMGLTASEIGLALLIGGTAGLAVGIALGANRFLSQAFESLLLYLGPTPKIIFFPVMIMWFGVGPGSKIAMGVLSCFFPIAISAAAGMRQIDPVLIRVGRSFRASAWQMTMKIYLHAMREPVINGIRLGMGVAVVGTLLAETKLSNKGLGYLVIQAYSLFDMPRMYALVIVLFVLAIGANALLGRLRR